MLLASALCLGLPAPAAAQSAPERAAKKPRPKAPNPRTRRAAEPRKKSPARPQGDPEKAAAAATTDATESGVKAAGTAVPEKPSAPEGEIREQQTADGVKRYEFGAIDVEGRLRSPQLLYFLRRVRAEFDAGALGHRSFLRELADTRNDAAFR